MRFTDELYAVAPAHVVLSDLLGQTIPSKGEVVVPCFNSGGHTHGSQNPNLRVNGGTGLYACHCGVKGDVVDLCIALGNALSKPGAMNWLRERHRVPDAASNGSSNGHHRPAPATFPYFPTDELARLGWTCTEFGGVPWVHGPVYDHTGERVGTKWRGARDENGKVRARSEGGPGLIGDVPALETIEPGKVVFVVCGEPDYFALHHHAEREGIIVRAVSHSHGEGSSFDIKPTEKNPAHRPVHKLLSGLHVVYVGDRDKKGEEAALVRCTEFPSAAKVTNLVLPLTPTQLRSGNKDLRDWLTNCGGTVRELLRLAEKPPEDVRPNEWDFAITKDLPDPPEPEMFVDRLFIRDSLNIIFGAPSSGKSWSAMSLLYDAVTTGGHFLDGDDLRIHIRSDGTPESCLWLFGSEDTADRVRRRLKKLDRTGDPNYPVTPGRFIYATLPVGVTSMHEKDGRAWAEELIQRHKPTVVVMDTLTSLCGSLDTNKAEQVVPLMQWLLRLRTERRVTLFLIHHTNKPAKETSRSIVSKAASMLGSQAFLSLAESVLMVDTLDGKTEDITIRCVKTKDIENPIPPFRVSFDRDTGRFRMLGEEETPPERQKVTGRKPKFSAEAVLALREKFPNGLLWKSVQDELKIGKSVWFEKQNDILGELLRGNCFLVQGVLSWGA